jgi:hypothetical protein
MYRLKRFNKKQSTSLNPADKDFIIFNPHLLKPCLPHPDGSIIVCSIDPGVRNFCIRVGCYSQNLGKTVTCLQKNYDLCDQKYNSPELNHIGANTYYYGALIAILEENVDILKSCQYVAVESQLKVNYDLIRMGQHIISTLMFLLKDKGNRPIIIEIDSRTKTQMLNAPKGMDKPARKKWAHAKGVEFLRIDGDTAWANYVENAKKGDDHGDVICYEKCILIFLLYWKVIPMPSK